MGKIKKHPHSGKTGAERDFIKLVDEMARTRRHSEVMNDFLEMAYCALAKTTHFPGTPRAEALEERYMTVVRRAKDDDYIRKMPKLMALTHFGILEDGDFLGKCAGEIGGLNEYLGQFFTPYEVCRLMARMNMGDAEPKLEQNGWISLCEPAVGGGAMILACAEYVEELGYDPTTSMFVEATDVSNTAYQMAYVQFTMRGIPALLKRGNTLSLEVWESEFTPPMEAFLTEHQESWLEWRRTDVLPRSDAVAPPAEALPLPSPPTFVAQPKPARQVAPTTQLSMF